MICAKDLVKVTDKQSLLYGTVGMVTGVMISLPLNKITVYFDHPLDQYMTFDENELEVFLEASLQYFSVGDKVEIVDKSRHAFGWWGIVTKVDPDYTIIYVKVEGEAIPRWYTNDQLQKIY